MPAELAFGVSAGQRAGHDRLAAELARLGYREVWSNDTGRGDGVVTLAQMAAGSASVRLGLGVVALSEHGPMAIARRLTAAGAPLDRLTLGVGAGSSRSLALVRDGVTELRSLLPGVPVAIAAVGPRMLRLGGEVADAIVATWALPERVSWIRERIAEGAETAGRPAPRLVLYLRTAVGPGADKRLRREMERYRRHGGHYARAFEAQGDTPVGAAVESGRQDELRSRLEPYRSLVDTLVIRALPSADGVDAWLDVAAAAAAALRDE